MNVEEIVRELVGIVSELIGRVPHDDQDAKADLAARVSALGPQATAEQPPAPPAPVS